jgi:uncharacterized protein YneF (UPF0154 family)
MTLLDIIIKILLFFLVFYGAIIISSFISNKIRMSQNDKEKDISDKKTL